MILAIAKCALNISWPKLPKVASNIDIIRAFPDFPKHMHHMPWSLDSSGKSEHINIINFIIAKTESGSLLILFIYTLFIFCVNIVRFGNDLRLTPQHDHSSNSILGQWNGLEPPARWAGATMQQLCRNGTGYACSIGGIYFWLFLVSWWCNVGCSTFPTALNIKPRNPANAGASTGIVSSQNGVWLASVTTRALMVIHTQIPVSVYDPHFKGCGRYGSSDTELHPSFPFFLFWN